MNHGENEISQQPAFTGGLTGSDGQINLQNIALEAAADGIFITDASGRIEWCNPAFLQMTGYCVEEVIKKTPRFLKSGVQDQEFYREMWGAILCGKVWRGELVNRRKDGSQFVAKQTITPVRDASGAITNFVAITQDITEQKNAQIELQHSEALLNKVLETLPVGLWLLDQDGKIVRGNPAGINIWSGARYVGPENYGEYKGWWVNNGKLIQPEEWAAARVFTKGETSLEDEVEIEDFNGMHKFILNSALPLQDDQEQLIGAVVINQDITARMQAERSLMQANELLEKLFSAVDILIAYMDREFNFIRVNPTFAKLGGYDPDYYPGKNYFALFPDAEMEAIFHTVVLSGEAYQTFEKPLIYKGFMSNDVMTYWDWSIQPVRDSSGSIQAAVLTLIDVTDRIRAERDLRESESRYRTLVESSPNGILVLDGERNIQFSNSQLAAMYGSMGSRTLVGQPLVNLFPTEERALITGIIDEVNEKGSVLNSEFTLLRLDGLRMPVEFSLSKLTNADGVSDTFIGELRDVTIQSEALASIRQNAQRAVVLSEVSKILVEASLDEQAILDAITRAAAEYIGDSATIRLASEDGLWLEPASFFHVNPDVRDIMKSTLQKYNQSAKDTFQGKVFQTGQTLYMPEADVQEIRDQSPDIYDRYIDEVGISSKVILPLRVRDTIIGTFTMDRDRDSRPYSPEDLTLMESLANRVALALSNARLYRELEVALINEQEMRDQLIRSERFAVAGRMLASITHEINNPIQTIKNCLYLSQQDLPTASPVHTFLNIAATETERIANLVAQLRQIYRPDRDGKEARVDLQVLLAEVENLLAPHLTGAYVSWKLTEYNGKPLVVIGNRDQLKQVLLNLCLNAIEAMQPDGGVLNIDLNRHEDGKRVRLIVRDTGSGIEEADLSRLFEPFFTTKSFGLGLGLPISFDIIQRHHGHITVASSPGEGTAFTILLPIGSSPDPT